jgi:hypothetical protein
MSGAAPAPDLPGPPAFPVPGAAAAAPPATAQQATVPAAARVSGLSCPSCGGALAVAPGLRVVACPFCQATLLARGELGIRRFAVEPRFSADQARETTSSWWGKGWNKHRALPREAKTAEAFLCFLPFFRGEADAVGYAFGTEERTRTVGSGKNRRTQRYEVDVERRLERHLDRTLPAVNTAEFGVARVHLVGDQLVPFDPDRLERLGMVFPPTRSESEARRQAVEEFRQEADPAKGLKRVHFRFLETLRERFSVVYYPLWVVRYRFRGRSYQAVVDGEDGKLAYGKAPGNDLFRALMLVGSEAGACFVFTTALQWGFKGDVDNPLGLLFGAGAVALAIFAWGFKHFRYGGVVEEGTCLAPRPGFSLKLGDSWKRLRGGA